MVGGASIVRIFFLRSIFLKEEIEINWNNLRINWK